MKTISLLALVGQVSAAATTQIEAGKTAEGRLDKNIVKVFNWHPSDASCGTADQDGNYWKVHYGKRENPHKKSTGIAGGFKPTFKSEGDEQFCHFDGLNDYLAVDKLFTKPTSSFTVKAKFRTTAKDNNWSLLDCDRSEYFNLSVTENGKIVFATSGMNAKKNKKTDDMSSVQGNLNDGKWHTVTAVFHDGVKSLFIDGWLDASSMQSQAAVPYNQVGTLNAKKKNVVRSCFIGDGSEASFLDGHRNYIHYEGDISSVEFYDGKVVIPNNPSFAYYPQVHKSEDGTISGTCVSETAYGWPVHVGKAGGSQPKFGGDGNLNYCEFDGKDDYLAIDKRYFNSAVKDFQIRAVFSTTWKHNKVNFNNWALFDCDRSEFFHLSVNGHGQILFSTAGKDEKGGAVSIHDMYSNTKNLNDGNWHEVIVKYGPDGTGNGALKQIFIDGMEDENANGKPNRKYDCVGGKCRNAIGKEKAKRFCFIGDGSEASSFDAGRNKLHYDGKIAVIDYVENGEELPGTSPLDCHSKRCQDWTCREWCACYEEAYEDLYTAEGCVDDGVSECECGWGRDGGYMIEATQ